MPPTPGAMPVAGPAAMAPAGAAPKQGKGLLYIGLALAIAGLGAGAVLYSMSGSTKEETVKKFARAPVGCTTTLQFDKQATFTLYLETKGKVDEVAGDCGANGASYDLGDDDPPRVTLSLVDGDDKEMDLKAASSPSYDTGTFKGAAVQTVNITAPGTYRLTVGSDAKDFAIAIGGDPEGDASSLQMAGIGAAAAGVLLGGLLILLGRRKKGAAAPAVSPGWQQAPAGVPGYQPQAPPYQPSPQQPAYPPQQPAYQPPPQQPPSYTPPPQAPPTPPETGWGAPHQ